MMLAHLRDYYTAPGMRGVRAHAARTVRDAMADHRIDARRIPEDRDWQPTGEPLAFAIDGRQMHDDAFGPAVAFHAYQWIAPTDPWAAQRFERGHAERVAARRFAQLDRIAQRQHV